MLVKLTDIRIDGGTQCRVALDQEWVQHFVERMKEGDIFPPVQTKFDGSTHWLWEGFHRYLANTQIGNKEIEVDSQPGTQEDAQIAALSANSKHGKPRTNADKKFTVERAFELPATRDKTDAEIARICDVSKPFVAAVRSPEKKLKQQESKKKHTVKKAKELLDEAASNQITDSDLGSVPDELELQANQRALEMDLDAMHKLLDSDDALQTAHDEIKRLNGMLAQFELRFHGLMNERNELVKEVKRLQAENDKLKGRK